MEVRQQIRASVEAMLAHQHESGAFVASPDFSQYGYCWLRDASFVAVALDRGAEHRAAARYHRWVDRTIGPAGIGPQIEVAIASQLGDRPLAVSELPPARFSLDGVHVSDDWPNFQLDGYGTWLWSLEIHLRATGDDGLLSELRPSVERTAQYLSAFAFEPCFDVWEENPGEIHTSTLASVYAGLRAAGALLGDSTFSERAAAVRRTMQDRAKQLGHFAKSSEQESIDGSLLWLGPIFNAVEADDPLFDDTVSAIEQALVFDGGVRRYPSDTYFGGGAWPVLTCSLGMYYAWVGQLEAAEQCLSWTLARFDEHGSLGEQFGGDRRDPARYREWVERWGPPARNLLWSHAMCVLLGGEIEAVSQARAAGVGPREDTEKERAHEGSEMLEGAARTGDDQ